MRRTFAVRKLSVLTLRTLLCGVTVCSSSAALVFDLAVTSERQVAVHAFVRK